MGGADAVGAGVAAADDEDVLAAGGDAVGGGDVDAGEDAVLLGEELEGEVDAAEVAAGDAEVAGGGGAGGEDDGVEGSLTPVPSPKGEGRRMILLIL